MTLLDQSLGALARSIPGATQVFHEHKLDFCCGGQISLRQAVADLILGGGFPPFVLQPINFEQLFAEQQQRRGSAQPTANA